MRLNIKKKHVLVIPKTATKLAVRSYKNISSLDFDTRPLANLHYIILASAVLAPTFTSAFLDVLLQKRYAVTDSEEKLVSASTVDKSLINTRGSAIMFNRVEVPDPEKPDNTITLAAGGVDGKNSKPYQAKMDYDVTKGITFGTSDSQRDMIITPDFTLSNPKYIDDRVVYPKSSNEKLLYTFRQNGIKNDIVLLEKPGFDTRTYSYTINLGDKLDAGMLPDGSIGIYSADNNLYAGAQVSDKKSQETFDEARRNGSKNYLVYVLPKPFMVDNSGIKNYNDTYYTLDKVETRNGKSSVKLHLKVNNLRNQQFPLSIDPTVVISTDSEFGYSSDPSANNNLNTNVSNQIMTSNINSGSMHNWQTAYTTTYSTGTVGTGGVSSSTLTGTGTTFTSAMTGGTITFSGGATRTVTFNSATTLALSSAATITNGTTYSLAYTDTSKIRALHASVQYKNYIYMLGGATAVTGVTPTAGSILGTTQYSNVSTPGYLSWSTSTTMVTPRTQFCAVTFNGYVYAIGGRTNPSNAGTYTMEYSKVNDSTGALGSWTQTSQLLSSAPPSTLMTVSAMMGCAIYNGYVYIVSGVGSDGSTAVSTATNQNVAILRLNAVPSASSIGTFLSAPNNYSLPNAAPANVEVVTYNGYLYALGGNNGGTVFTTVARTKINTDGSIGTWSTTGNSQLPTGRTYSAVGIYNGYIYLTGGQPSNCEAISSLISNDGTVDAWNYNDWYTNCSGGTPTTIIGHHTMAVLNGYVYMLGGNNLSTTLSPNFRYASIGEGDTEHDNGSLTAGTQYWLSTNGPSTTRAHNNIVAWNGRLYHLGGCYDTGAVGDALDGSCDSGYVSNNFSYNTIQTGGPVDGSWVVSGNLLASSRNRSCSVVYNGFVYVTGGSTGTAYPGTNQTTLSTNTVQRAQINSSTGANAAFGTTTAMPLNLDSHACVVSDGYIYVIGGNADGVWSSAVYSAILNANGSVGTWNAQSSLATQERYSAAVTYNGYIYLMGGESGAANAYSSAVQYAAVCTQHPDVSGCSAGTPGTISAWSTTSSLVTARRGHTAGVSNGYIFVAKGYNAGYLGAGNIEFAKICDGVSTTGGCSGQPQGYVGTWYTSDVRSPFFSAYLGGAVYNGYFYTSTGTNSATLAVSLYYGQIGPRDGYFTGGSSTATSVSLPEARHQAKTLAYNGRVYIIGGLDSSSNYLNSIKFASFNSDGSGDLSGAWTTATNTFNTPRSTFGAFIANGYMYVIGGNGNGTNLMNDVQYASINPTTGNIDSPWRYTYNNSSSSSFINGFYNARAGLDVTYYNGYVYITGGTDVGNYYNDVQYAKVNDDGTLGNWYYTSSFATGRAYHSALTYGDNLFIIAGKKAASSTDCVNYGVASSNCADIQRAKINSNGTLASWVTVSYLISDGTATRAAEGGTAVAYGGFLYTIGSGNLSSWNYMAYTTISESGEVGNVWTNNETATSRWIPPLSSGRYYHSSFAYNGYIYTAGGWNGAALNTIEYIKPQNAQNKARYERVIDMATVAGGVPFAMTSTNIKSITINGFAPCGYNVTYRTATNASPDFGASSTTVENVLPGKALNVNVSGIRYIHLVIELDDRSCGSTSYITDINVKYNSYPSTPELNYPLNGATGVSRTPEFRLGATDEDGDYLMYKIEVCSNNAFTGCSPSLIRLSQVDDGQLGWIGQSKQNATAYASGTSIIEYAIHRYQASSPTLSPNTTYYWRGYAIDPGGTNTWSNASSPYSFTTGSSTMNANDINIGGGTNIYGGTTLSPN